MKKETKLFIEKIESAKKILLVAHKNLDGDALGSMLALHQLIFLNYGREAVCVYDGNMPEYLHDAPLRERAHYFAQVDLNKKFDLAILLDYGTVNNLGAVREAVENSKFIIEIDHHKNDDKLGALCLDDDTASATACILYDLMCDAKWKYDSNVLDLIALGILTDTGNFKFVKDGRAMRIMAELVDQGVEVSKLLELLNNQRRKTIQTEARAVADAEFFYRNRLAVAVIDSANYKNLDGRGANALSWLGQIKGVEYVVLLKEQKENQIGVSLRSRTMPINQIAEKLGGGGHMCAAGAVVMDSLENVKKQIIDLFKGV
ncbi:MAG: DHH family phosphoesterase [Alphaproteobacteria bacterium]|nr:DHH family phosphoesterase [Alphaproteobacteria bacterium]